jgi:hypothetical protein
MAQEFLRVKSERALYDFLALPKVGLALGLSTTKCSLTFALRNYPDLGLQDDEETRQVDRPEQTRFAETRREIDAPTEEQRTLFRATRLIEKGFLSRAAKAIANPGRLAQSSPETKVKL